MPVTQERELRIVQRPLAVQDFQVCRVTAFVASRGQAQGLRSVRGPRLQVCLGGPRNLQVRQRVGDVAERVAHRLPVQRLGLLRARDGLVGARAVAAGIEDRAEQSAADQISLPPDSSVSSSLLCAPPNAVRRSAGNCAARATPIACVAAASCASACCTSGRRVSNSDGRPGGGSGGSGR